MNIYKQYGYNSSIGGLYIMKFAVFIIGTIIGSFLNVCIYRIPRGQSILYPSSKCTNCNTRIEFFDLVPILSYIFLRGRCRHCNNKISPMYIIIEILTGISFVFIFLKYGLVFEFFKYSIFIVILLLIAAIDIYNMNVYFSTIVIGISLAIIFLIFEYFYGYYIKTFFYGGIVSGIFIYLIIMITGGGMGWGDVEVCAIAGLFLGLKLVVFMIMISFFLGTLIGIILLILKVKSRKDYLPFVPFIFVASLITVLVGDKFIKLYISIF